MHRRIIRGMVTAAMSTAVLVGMGAGAASAGEITGSGPNNDPRSLEVVPVEGGDPVVHGKSFCAYSGLNDERALGDEDAPLVQTPAGAKRFVGIACRGNLSGELPH